MADDAIIAALKELLDAVESLALYPEGAVGLDHLLEAEEAARVALHDYEKARVSS